jgi:hypothetical protein
MRVPIGRQTGTAQRANTHLGILGREEESANQKITNCQAQEAHQKQLETNDETEAGKVEG